MSRQFLNTDSSRWREGFGKGSAGDLSYGGGSFGGQAGYGFATFTGTSGAFSGTFTDQAYFNGGNGGRIGDIVLIHQSQLTGAGNWELNLITGRSGSTLSLKYPLQNNYTTGAQVVSSAQWKNLTFTGTTTPYLSWNGAAGGILFLMAKDTITINGTVSVSGGNGSGPTRADVIAGGTGGGFRGGCGDSIAPVTNTRSGEGTSGPPTYLANPNGSGGGNKESAAGGGGGNASAGGNSAGLIGAGDTKGGSSAGNTQLTSMVFGGGGGGGNGGWSNSYAGSGASGGGIVFLIAKNIVIGSSASINLNGGAGGAGGSSGDGKCGGGGGAGGSCLLKSVNATLGSNKITASGGVGGTSTERIGGKGSVGRIHLDYSKSYSGSTSPGLDVRQDLTIKAGNTGAFFQLL